MADQEEAVRKASDKFEESVLKSAIFFRNTMTEITEKQKVAAQVMEKLRLEAFNKSMGRVADSVKEGPIDFAAIGGASEKLMEELRKFDQGGMGADENKQNQQNIAKLLNEIHNSEQFKRADMQDGIEGNLLQELLKRMAPEFWGAGDDLAAKLNDVFTRASRAANQMMLGANAPDQQGALPDMVKDVMFGQNRKGDEEPINDQQQVMNDLSNQLSDTKQAIKNFGDTFKSDKAKKIIENVTNLSLSLNDAVKGVTDNPLFKGGKGEGEGEDVDLFTHMKNMNKKVGDMVVHANEMAAKSAESLAAYMEKMDSMIKRINAMDNKLRGQSKGGSNTNGEPRQWFDT